ncbi:TPA: RNA polymerase subunit sigma, partial [Burkholderia cenocepacia]|nr:RNA polymerase subunit sigma [Burkholderia cenocepacia]
GRRKLAALLGGAPATEGRPGRAPAGGTASEAIDGL